jgi:folate-binding protein YgfZ
MIANLSQEVVVAVFIPGEEAALLGEMAHVCWKAWYSPSTRGGCMKSTSSDRAEYEALRNGAGLLDLEARGRFAVQGDDRARFLHNMLTNDIASLQPGEGCNAVKVSLQGKMEAALRVLCLDDAFWCDLEGEALEGVLAGLRRYAVLEDANLEDTRPAWSLLSLQGPASREVLRRLALDPAPLVELHRHMPASVAGAKLRLVRSDHTGDGGFDLWVPATAAAALKEALVDAGALAVGPRALAVRRMETGIPRHGSEITPEHFPQEAGLDEGWISYTKGCYLGQETIARIHHLGHVNWSLCGLSFDGSDVPAAGDTLRVGDKEVGNVTSAAFSIGLERPIALAYLRREHAEPGTEIVVGSSQARVASLPFL